MKGCFRIKIDWHHGGGHRTAGVIVTRRDLGDEQRGARKGDEIHVGEMGAQGLDGADAGRRGKIGPDLSAAASGARRAPAHELAVLEKCARVEPTKGKERGEDCS